MKQFIKTVSDEVLEEVKDMGRIAKKQITSDSNKASEDNKDNKKDPKVDPITGKKPPTKQQLNDLKQQTAQLQMTKLKKVREELEKQRLKVTEAKKLGQIQTDDKAPKDDAVAKTLKASKSTGEFKGLIGG